MVGSGSVTKSNRTPSLLFALAIIALLMIGVVTVFWAGDWRASEAPEDALDTMSVDLASAASLSADSAAADSKEQPEKSPLARSLVAVQATWRIFGRVAEEDGTPVAGADVTFYRLTSSDERDLRLSGLELGQVRSDRDGKYELVLPTSLHPLAPSLYADLIGVRVVADGFETYEWERWVKDEAIGDFRFDVEVDRLTYDMLCRVQTSSGEPVLDASFTFAPGGLLYDRQTLQVDDLGGGRYGLQVNKNIIDLRAEHLAHGWSERRSFSLPLADEATIIINQQSHEISGRVRFGDGSPASGLALRFLSQSQPQGQSRPSALKSSKGRSLFTDEDGRFTAQLQTPGRYKIEYEWQDDEVHRGQPFEAVLAQTDREPVEIACLLTRIVLVVRDPSGRSLYDARVSALAYPSTLREELRASNRSYDFKHWDLERSIAGARSVSHSALRQLWVPPGSFVQVAAAMRDAAPVAREIDCPATSGQIAITIKLHRAEKMGSIRVLPSGGDTQHSHSWETIFELGALDSTGVIGPFPAGPLALRVATGTTDKRGRYRWSGVVEVPPEGTIEVATPLVGLAWIRFEVHLGSKKPQLNPRLELLRGTRIIRSRLIRPGSKRAVSTWSRFVFTNPLVLNTTSKFETGACEVMVSWGPDFVDSRHELQLLPGENRVRVRLLKRKH